jgi:hypothetical protein
MAGGGDSPFQPAPLSDILLAAFVATQGFDLGPVGARREYREFLAEETDAAIRATNAQVLPWGQTRRV